MAWSNLEVIGVFFAHEMMSRREVYGLNGVKGLFANTFEMAGA